MKKVDKLVLKAFLGPFFLTLFVVVFILLMVNLLKYFDDLVGKDLGWQVFAEFMGYFAVYMTPMSIPLAVLLSSLMAYGNLGEHSELTAIKGAGISLSRSMRSVFFFVVIITAVTFYSNNFIAPMTALKAYSLLYDIKQKKPALDLKQGTFYSGMKDFSIKVNEKYPDGKTLKDLIIYDHSDARGNTEVIVADSGKMYTVHNDRYLKMELFDGYYFMEGSSANPNRKTVSRDKVSPYSRTRFSKSEMMFDLSEFDLQRTKEELFSKDRLVRGLNQLYKDMDSISYELLENRYETMVQTNGYYNYHLKGYEIDYPDEFQLIIKNRDSIEAIKSRINYDISKGDTVSRGIKKGVLNALILPDKPPLTSEDAPKFKPKDDLV